MVDRFDQGTLVTVSPHPAYADQGTAHAYYVPKRSQVFAAHEQAAKDGTTDALPLDKLWDHDQDALADHVSVADIVEWAEEQTLNRADGAIGANRMSPRPSVFWGETGRSGEEKSTIPGGVVKFADPDIDGEDATYREPVERGRFWAAVQEHVRTDMNGNQPRYRDGIQQAPTHKAARRRHRRRPDERGVPRCS